MNTPTDIKCNVEGCQAIAKYGKENNQPIKCFTHRGNLRRYVQFCIYNDCNAYSAYGFDRKHIVYCKKHKLVGMDDHRYNTKKCPSENCNRYKHYGYGKKKMFCKQHALKGMKNLHNNICNHVDCNTSAHFGNQYRKPLFCASHQQDGMFNVMKEVNSEPLNLELNDFNNLELLAEAVDMILNQ